MSNKKWTPGPWGYIDCFRTDDDFNADGMNSMSGIVFYAHTEGLVVFPNEANAHLIAAAPDLYDDNQAAIDSLEFALSEMQENDIITQDDAELMQERIASLKASAAKARGEA